MGRIPAAKYQAVRKSGHCSMQKSPRRRLTHDAETRQCIIAELRLAAKGGLGTLADQGAVGERKAMLERLVYSRQSPHCRPPMLPDRALSTRIALPSQPLSRSAVRIGLTAVEAASKSSSEHSGIFASRPIVWTPISASRARVTEPSPHIN